MTNLREHKCHHIDWRQERTWMWRFQWCHRSKVLKAHGEHRHIMPGDCLTSGGALRKVEWPAWALMEGRTQDKGHLAPPLPWLCAIDKRWHYGQDTWVSKRRHTSPHTWLKPKVDCWKSRPELTLSLVWWKSPKVSMSASFWWHNLMWSRKKKKKKYCNRSNLPSSWNQPTTGPQDNSRGMSSLGHLVNVICTTTLANPRHKMVLQIFNQGILKHGALWGLGPRQAPYLP